MNRHDTFWAAAKRLMTCVLILSTTSCASIGEYRVPAPEREQPAGSVTDPVVLIILEGVRRDSFGAYLRSLKDRGHEPSWSSGLSFLRRSGFRFAQAELAEAPFPPLGLVSNASIMTARQPGEHGIVDTAFIDTDDEGSLNTLAYDSAFHAAGIWADSEGRRPTQESPTRLQSMVLSESWLRFLAQTHSVITVYSPFGQGTEQVLPENRTGGTLGVLDTRQGRLATPLLDRASASVFERVLLQKPALTVTHFRQAESRCRHLAWGDCGADTMTVHAEQQTALKAIDALLFRPLRRYRLEEPSLFERTHFLVVGTHGVGDLPPRNAEAGVVNEDSVTQALRKSVSGGQCESVVTKAQKDGDLNILVGVGTAQVHLRRCVPGACQKESMLVECLGMAGERILDVAPWAVASVWQTMPSGLRGARNDDVRVALNADFSSKLPAHRRQRMLEKLRASHNVAGARGGLLTIYRRSPWMLQGFAGVEDRMAAPVGGLNETETGVPFLIVSRALEDTVGPALRTAPVELTDIGPTVFSILRVAPPPRLPSQPILRWNGGEAPRLAFNRADRRLGTAPLTTQPRLLWKEDGEEIALSFQESKSLWPPESLTLALGTESFRWDGDADQFEKPAPCVVNITEDLRRWTCVFPVSRSGKTQTLKGSAQRIPGPASDPPFELSQMFKIDPAGMKPFAVKLVCASDSETRVAISGEQQDAVDSIAVSWVGPRSTRWMRQLGARFQLQTESLAACDGDEVPCFFETGDHGVHVKFKAMDQGLNDIFWSSRLEGNPKQKNQVSPGESLGLRHPTASQSTLRKAWLEVDICTRNAGCITQFLATDAEFSLKLKAGCGPGSDR